MSFILNKGETSRGPISLTGGEIDPTFEVIFVPCIVPNTFVEAAGMVANEVLGTQIVCRPVEENVNFDTQIFTRELVFNYPHLVIERSTFHVP